MEVKERRREVGEGTRRKDEWGRSCTWMYWKRGQKRPERCWSDSTGADFWLHTQLGEKWRRGGERGGREKKKIYPERKRW